MAPATNFPQRLADAPRIAQPLAAYLERAQLTHLHAQVAELTDRLQAAEEALHTARAEVAEANESADMWRCTVTNILAEVREICKAPMPQGSQGVDIDALNRSSTQPTGNSSTNLSPGAIAKLTTLLKTSPFVTVGEAAQTCGMTAVSVTAESEGMLRTALEAAGCERAKRQAADGERRWGYVSPNFGLCESDTQKTGGAA